MSRDSSVSSSSKVSQFGLYRTIDARTEEFLRLSRKRQIRQGCACAAASAAITVTVVIVVFFIYEFSLNSDITLGTSFKSSWLNLMNDTSGDSSFDPKFNKANIDRATLKLLPLLIRAIKKNAYLEKLLEDHSSSSPSYDDKATEDAFEQNTFSKNWFQMPTTKLYAIEYKTSPVVFYKNPTENIEYYTKIRKIRDYQRVFNYVDKMISDKVYIRSTKPMLKGEIYTDKPPVRKQMPVKKTTRKSTTSSQIIRKIQKISKNSNAKFNSSPEFHCKCPKKFSEMLHKILASVQMLLPDTSYKEMYQSNGCKKSATQASTLSPTNANTNLLNSISDLSVKSHMFTTTKTLKFNQVTEPTTYVTNYIDSPFIIKALEQSTKLENILTDLNVDKTRDNVEQTTQSVLFINKYKHILPRKQLLRNHVAKTSNTFYEPIFDGIEYDDYYPTTKNPIKSAINNRLNLIKTKINYISDNNVDMKQTAHKLNDTVVYKKITSHFHQTTPTDGQDIKPVNNTFTLFKIKPMQRNKINIDVQPNNKNKILHPYSNRIIQFLRPAPSNVTERIYLTDLVTSTLPDSDEIPNTTEQMISKFDESTKHEQSSSVTQKPFLFKTTDVETDTKNFYHMVKKYEKPFHNKQIKKIESSTNFSPEEKYTTTTDAPKHTHFNHFKDSKRNSKAFFYWMKNDSKPILNKKSDSMTDDNDLTSMTTSRNTESSRGNDPIVDDVEFTTGEISEITKQPEPTIDKPDKNIVKKTDDYNLTWEDLKSENTPKLSPIAPEPKPFYLEFHRNDIIHEEPLSDDYNINSNFYDLVL